MHDCYNSWIIYYSKKSRTITEKLSKLFQKLIIYGLHIHGIYNLYNFHINSLLIYIYFYRWKSYFVNL